MNKQTIKHMAWALVPVLLLTFSACKDNKKDDPAPAKTLNKTSLTNNKIWYNKGGTISHDFNVGGLYGGSGEWRWVRNSDTMEIKMTSSGNFVKWKFNWNTDTDMECEWIGNGPAELFKSSAW